MDNGGIRTLDLRNEVITRRFLEDTKTTLAEIGETFGVTKERVQQIEGKALSKLKSALAERGVRQRY